MQTIVLSPSMAASASTCTTQSLLRTQGYGMGPESKQALAGRVFHRALELWLMGRSVDECLLAFHAEYDDYSDKYLTLDDKYHKVNLDRILNVYLRRNRIADQPFEVIEAEQQIELEEELHPKLRLVLTDIVDGVVRMRDGSGLWAMEHKTTGGWITQDYVRDYSLRGQIISHTHLARMHGFPVVGVLLNVIEINKLPELGRLTDKGVPYKCREHKIPYEECWAAHVRFERFQIQVSEDVITRWLHDVQSVAVNYKAALLAYDDLTNAPREGVLSGACSRCDFQDFCLAPSMDRLTRRVKDGRIRSSGLELG